MEKRSIVLKKRCSPLLGVGGRGERGKVPRVKEGVGGGAGAGRRGGRGRGWHLKTWIPGLILLNVFVPKFKPTWPRLRHETKPWFLHFLKRDTESLNKTSSFVGLLQWPNEKQQEEHLGRYWIKTGAIQSTGEFVLLWLNSQVQL